MDALPSELQWYIFGFLNQLALVMLKRTCRSFRKLLAERFKPRPEYPIKKKLVHACHLELDTIPLDRAAKEIFPNFWVDWVRASRDVNMFRWLIYVSGMSIQKLTKKCRLVLYLAIKLGYDLDMIDICNDNEAIRSFLYHAGKYANMTIIKKYGFMNRDAVIHGAYQVGDMRLLMDLKDLGILWREKIWAIEERVRS